MQGTVIALSTATATALSSSQENERDSPSHLTLIFGIAATALTGLSFLWIAFRTKKTAPPDSSLLTYFCDQPSSTASAVKRLLNCGADVNAKTLYGRTPLHLHLNKPNPNANIVKLLLDKGADVNANTSYNENTPFHLYLNNLNPNASIVKLLLDRGADVNAKNLAGETPLYVYLGRTACHPCTNIVKLLLDKGADVNAENLLGQTPLHAYLHAYLRYYFRDPNVDVISLLIQKGAKVLDIERLPLEPPKREKIKAAIATGEKLRIDAIKNATPLLLNLAEIIGEIECGVSQPKKTGNGGVIEVRTGEN